MIKTSYICNCCLEEYELNGYILGSVIVNPNATNVNSIQTTYGDICDLCIVDIKKFIEGLKNKRSPNKGD